MNSEKDRPGRRNLTLTGPVLFLQDRRKPESRRRPVRFAKKGRYGLFAEKSLKYPHFFKLIILLKRKQNRV
jgi:hypothetical protein